MLKSKNQSSLILDLQSYLFLWVIEELTIFIRKEETLSLQYHILFTFSLVSNQILTMIWIYKKTEAVSKGVQLVAGRDPPVKISRVRGTHLGFAKNWQGLQKVLARFGRQLASPSPKLWNRPWKKTATFFIQYSYIKRFFPSCSRKTFIKKLFRPKFNKTFFEIQT